MTQHEWQASPKYQAMKQRVFQAQYGRCLDCGDQRRTELHYERTPMAWGQETDSDVVGLCQGCHSDRHLDLHGDFWPDAQEKEAYWSSFWDAMDKDD